MGNMADPRVKDTLLLIGLVSGLVTVAVLSVAITTSQIWWVAVFMTVVTAWFGVLYIRELRRFTRDSGGAAGL